MIITIDGHAGSGKSTAATQLADALGFELLNTGAMYRATAFELMRRGFALDAEPRDVEAITSIIEPFHFELTDAHVKLNGEDLLSVIQSEEMGRAASRVGTFLEVRRKLQQEQRRIADGRDMICEGRDQGTVVFPNAPVKFFFTASAEHRARRRAIQDKLTLAHDSPEFAKFIEQIIARDHQDETRDIDPLQKAADAVPIDTSNLSQEMVLAHMVEVVQQWRTMLDHEM